MNEDEFNMDEALKRLLSSSPSQAETEIEAGARTMRLTFTTLVNAGFSEEQALTILLAMISASVRGD